MKRHQIRIVGGEYRRTPIPVVDAAQLRPTPDRMRETLFNWLGHFWGGDFAGKQVLDLFAGSGALGFEAASRGVEHATLVENSPAALAALRALQQRLRTQRVTIVRSDALAYLRSLRQPQFDLVLLDPPFAAGWLERLWPLLPRAARPGALVYVESGDPLREPPPGLEPLREARAGHVHVQLSRFAALQKNMNNAETGSPVIPDGLPARPNAPETA